MKANSIAVAAFVLSAWTETQTYAFAFTPSALSVTTPSAPGLVALGKTGIINSNVNANRGSRMILSAGGGLLSSDDEDDYDDDDDDDDDDYALASSKPSSYSSSLSSSNAFANLKLDPYDPNPTIKPRPGRYGFNSLESELEKQNAVPDDQLTQTMSQDERKENLKIMRQIKKSDLADLRLRKDHAGWVEANTDLKRREKSDPWFDLNERIREAYQLGDMETSDRLKKIVADQLNGPPPGVKVDPERGYAVHTDIYDVGISASRAQSAIEQSILEERVKRGRAMAVERAKNMEKEQKDWEDMMRNPGDREDKEAKERRERTMRRLMGEIEEENKKREERAKEMLGKLPEMPQDSKASLERALDEARADVKRLRKMRREGRGLGEVSDDADLTFMNPEDRLAAKDASVPKPKGSAAKAREAAEAEAAGGRPRLPGDADVTQGELNAADMPGGSIESSSTTTSGPLTVQVTSNYNTQQSDPPMRKHCFQYTIRITNNSPTDTIQLLSRRFEIQTVGSSMKDVVQGEGVTGRQPILKPGEVFEYTSTAPLSVRPIGTTEIAARMKGEYKYVTLKGNQETATPEQVSQGGDASAELGTFHFIFPDEQRVKPVSSVYEEEDEDDTPAASTTSAATATPPAAPMKSASPTPQQPPATPSSPASTLPGDSDMSSGNIADTSVADFSNVITDNVRVQVSSTYRTERSDSALNKHCFAYNVRITNESPSQNVQLVSRRFEIQTIGSETKDVVQGPGVTGRQPILKPGESFEYTSTAPLSVKPMLDKTKVVARMEGEYNFVLLGDDGATPVSSNPLQAKMGVFHFILPQQ